VCERGTLNLDEPKMKFFLLIKSLKKEMRLGIVCVRETLNLEEPKMNFFFLIESLKKEEMRLVLFVFVKK